MRAQLYSPGLVGSALVKSVSVPSHWPGVSPPLAVKVLPPSSEYLTCRYGVRPSAPGVPGVPAAPSSTLVVVVVPSALATVMVVVPASFETLTVGDLPSAPFSPWGPVSGTASPWETVPSPFVVTVLRQTTTSAVSSGRTGDQPTVGTCSRDGDVAYSSPTPVTADEALSAASDALSAASCATSALSLTSSPSDPTESRAELMAPFIERRYPDCWPVSVERSSPSAYSVWLGSCRSMSALETMSHSSRPWGLERTRTAWPTRR